MIYVFPDYYKDFRCIASDCRHNCCIGWEIDIDSETAKLYRETKGELGRRLSENISYEDVPHFILAEHDRCPFLNKDNLCDIILNLGEDALCDICAVHPRFVNELEERTETGIGLCCEEAARLILGKKTPTMLEFFGESDVCDEDSKRRDDIFKILQNRGKSIFERVDNMLRFCNAGDIPDLRSGVILLLALERLDEAWTGIINKLSVPVSKDKEEEFSSFIRPYETEYEQLLVYFIYRYFVDYGDLAAAFAAFAFYVIYAAHRAVFLEKGTISFEERVDIVRMFSAETEYSEDNLELIFDELSN